MSRLPNRVAELRQERGLSQRRLAALLGISQPLLSMYEAGDRDIPPDVVGALRRHLGVRTGELWLDPRPAAPVSEAALARA